MTYRDVEASGLLPLWTGYPQAKVIKYLEAHSETRLTPALAREYPSLVTEYGVYDWVCEACGNHQAWDDVDWDEPMEPPECQACASRGILVPLSGPPPASQQNSWRENPMRNWYSLNETREPWCFLSLTTDGSHEESHKAISRRVRTILH